MTAEQVAGWDAELSELTGSLGRLFNRPEPRVVFTQYVEGLLAELPKKNGWVRHEAPCDRVEVRDLHRRAVAAAG
ncbi:hypothetical protein ACWCQZ_47810 [Streptomyces sp. NPDC002285]